MTESKVLRGIVVALIITWVIFTLAGCAISDGERAARIDRWNQIERDYYVFADECEFLEGSLHTPHKQGHNGIPNPWEMKDSVCYLDGRSIEMTEW